METFGGKKIKIFSKTKMFSVRSNKWLKIISCLMSAVEMVEVKI